MLFLDHEPGASGIVHFSILRPYQAHEPYFQDKAKIVRSQAAPISIWFGYLLEIGLSSSPYRLTQLRMP